MQKRSKERREQDRNLQAQAFNEGFQMGYKEGYNDAMRKLQDSTHTDTARSTFELPDMS